jgi:hypothetical protein
MKLIKTKKSTLSYIDETFSHFPILSSFKKTYDFLCLWPSPLIFQAAKIPAQGFIGCVAKFFKIRDNARFLEIEKPND